MLSEPPTGTGVVDDGSLDKCIGHRPCAAEQLGCSLRIRGVLRCVEEDVAHAGSPAAPTVVVPETRTKPTRDARAQDRMEAALAQVGNIVSGDLIDARVPECRERMRG